MAKCEIKNIVSILLMIILVVAQAYGSPVPSTSSVKRNLICVGQCGLKCIPVIQFPPVYAACVSTCGLLICHKVSSKSAYGCATTCVMSKSVNVNKGIFSWNLIS